MLTTIQQTIYEAAQGVSTAYTDIPLLPYRFNLQSESEATRAMFYACRILVKRGQPITRKGVTEIWRSTLRIEGWHHYLEEFNQVIPFD